MGVAHVTCNSDTSFKVKRSKVKVTRPLWLAIQLFIWTAPYSMLPPRARRCLSTLGRGQCGGLRPTACLHRGAAISFPSATDCPTFSYRSYLHQGGYVFTGDCLSVCYCSNDCHDIRRKGDTWTQEKSVDFGGNPDHVILRLGLR